MTEGVITRLPRKSNPRSDDSPVSQSWRRPICTRWSSRLKLLFLIAPALNGVFISVANLNFNLERALAIVFCVPLARLIISYTSTQLSPGERRFSYSPTLVALWCCSLLISTLLSNDPISHISGYIILSFPFLLYLLFSGGDDSRTIVHRWAPFVLAYLAFGAIVTSALGINVDDAVRALGRNAASQSQTASAAISTGGVRFTILEANIFGCTVAYLLLLNLHRFRLKFVHLLLATAALAALVLSYSRGPYLGFVIGLITYAFLWAKLHRKRGILIIAASVAALAAIVALASEDVTNFYEQYLNRQSTVRIRIFTLQLAIEQFYLSPIFGNGPLDSGYFAPYLLNAVGAQHLEASAIWQMFVGIAHDTGLIGLTIYAVFLFGAFRHGYRAILETRDPARISYFASATALLVASQTTTVHYTALFGIALGLLGSNYYLTSEVHRRVQSGPPTASIRRSHT